MPSGVPGKAQCNGFAGGRRNKAVREVFAYAETESNVLCDDVRAQESVEFSSAKTFALSTACNVGRPSGLPTSFRSFDAYFP